MSGAGQHALVRTGGALEHDPVDRDGVAGPWASSAVTAAVVRLRARISSQRPSSGIATITSEVSR